MDIGLLETESTKKFHLEVESALLILLMINIKDNLHEMKRTR